jgi:hypothetical protein
VLLAMIPVCFGSVFSGLDGLDGDEDASEDQYAGEVAEARAKFVLFCLALQGRLVLWF